MEPQRDPAHHPDLERCEVFAEQSATGELVLRLAGTWTLQNRFPPLEEVRKSLESITGVCAPSAPIGQIEPISAGAQETLQTATAGLNDARAAVQDTRGLIANVGGQVEPISTAAQGTLQEVQAAMAEARGLIANVDSQVEPISTEAQQALKIATAGIEEAHAAVRDKA